MRRRCWQQPTCKAVETHDRLEKGTEGLHVKLWARFVLLLRPGQQSDIRTNSKRWAPPLLNVMPCTRGLTLIYHLRNYNLCDTNSLYSINPQSEYLDPAMREVKLITP